MKLKLRILILITGYWLLITGFTIPGFDPLYNRIKTEIITQASALLGQEISVEKVEGNLILGLTLKKVKIAGIGEAKSLSVSYNPIKLAATRDPLASISKITVFEPVATVIREKSGEFNVAKLISQGKPGKFKGLPFSGRVVVVAGRGKFIDQLGIFPTVPKPFVAEIEGLNGEVKFYKDGRILIKTKGNVSVEKSLTPLAFSGQFDLAKGRLKISLDAPRMAVERWGFYAFNLPENVDLKGLARFHLKVAGTFSNPEIEGKVEALKGASFYNQIFQGLGSFTYRKNLLAFKVDRLDIYKGKIQGLGELNFGTTPIAVSAKFKGTTLDFAELAQKLPKISGTFDGDLNISGNLSSLIVDGQSTSKNILVLGQPIEEGKLSISIQDGQTTLKDLYLRSKVAEFKASGVLSKGMVFDLTATSSGIELSDKTLLGGFRAKIDRFNGRVAGKIDEAFMKNPLRQLSAKGEIKLISGKIARQPVSEALGVITLEHGLLKVEGFFVRINRSLVSLSGQTGLGVPTDLRVSGKEIDARDLMFLKTLLPPEISEVSGKVDLECTISGLIPENADLTSLKPFLDLKIEGETSLKDAIVADQKVKNVFTKGRFENHEFILDQAEIQTETTSLSASGKIDQEGRLDFGLEGSLDLLNLRPLTAQYGNLRGQVNLKTKILGKTENLDIDCIFLASDIRYNDIYLERFSGRLHHKDQILTLLEPITLNQAGDEYIISGQMDLKGSNLSLRIDIPKGDLGTAVSLWDMIFWELKAKQAPAPKIKIDFSRLEIPNLFAFREEDGFLLYKADAGRRIKPVFLEAFGKIDNEVENFKAALKTIGRRNAKGRLAASIFLEGPLKSPRIRLSGSVLNGRWEAYEFDELWATCEVASSVVSIESISLKKGGGELGISGKVNLEGEISLKIAAAEMPIDFLSLLVKLDKPFEGRLNLDAQVSGQTASPEISAIGEIINGGLAGVSFSELAGVITVSKNTLYIQELNIYTAKHKASIFGKIPFSRSEEMKVAFDLPGENVGLLASIFRDVNWVAGDGRAQILLSGTINKPKVNGSILLKFATLNIAPWQSQLTNINSEILITDNFIRINKLNGFWSGKTTKAAVNVVDLSGTIDLRRLTDERMVDLDLKLADADFTVNLPWLYMGEVELREIALKGSYFLDRTDVGPKLTGAFRLKNGNLPLGAPVPAPPIELGLTINIEKNVYLMAGTTGGVFAGDFSNILLNLEMTGEDIKVAGTLSEPSVTGKLIFKRGTVNILNREFTLMSLERQKLFYPYDLEKVKENTAVFGGWKGKEGALPQLTIVAEAKVEELEAKTGTYREMIVVSHLTGIPYAAERERGIDIKFEPFTPEFVRVPYGDEEVRVLLLPDFIKAGIKGELTEEQVKRAARQYLSGQLQAFLLKGVERELEKSLGLESLTLEYNFGKDLERLLPAAEPEEPARREAFGVGLAKGFFDRLYIDVRYTQAIEQKAGESESALNYQITLKLSPYWSLIYYREPLTFEEKYSTYYKWSLKATYPLY